MKFRTSLDANTFLAEVRSFDKVGSVKESYEPTKEELSEFIKSRGTLVKKLKNSRKSNDQKANWRKNRSGMMKGIKAFHKSVKGKRFHKRLGRFLASRIFRKKRSNEGLEDAYEGLLLKQSYLKGLNAAKQHLFVELEYFHQLEEQVDLELFITDYAIPLFRSIELKVLEGADLEEDEISFLFDILEKDVVLGSLAQSKGVEFAQIKKLWNSIQEKLIKDGITEEEADFYTHIVQGLKSDEQK